MGHASGVSDNDVVMCEIQGTSPDFLDEYGSYGRYIDELIRGRQGASWGGS